MAAFYAHRHVQRDPETSQVEKLASLGAYIKDGYVSNGKKLRDQIKAMVAERQAAEAASKINRHINGILL